MRVFPADTNSILNYTFNIMATADGGVTNQTGPHTLILSCNETIITPDLESDSKIETNNVINLLKGESGGEHTI